MDDDAAPDPLPPPEALPAPPPAAHGPVTTGWAARIIALFEVIICSDYPTQIVLATAFASFGYTPFTHAHRLSVSYVVALSLIDTGLLVGLIVLFLRAHGERPRDIFLGRRPAAREAALGVPLIVAAFLLGITVLGLIQHFAPSLHTVPRNPLEDLIRSGRDAWLFALVVVVAGGVREELQRAFLLHRFSQSLGGAWVGVVVTSVAFGAGHLVQGRDAMVATGTLGAFWAVVYLARRSVLAPMVSHAGFDLIEIVAGRMLP